MNDQAHRNFQNLPKIGPVYSTKDEKQRIIAEEILNYRIRPELKLKLNMNIPGLTKKKTITPVNPETRRIFTRVSSQGREGWTYIWLMPNISRFVLPVMFAAFYFYAGHSLTSARFWQTRNNNEWEAVYCKMQSIPGHYADRWSLMA